MTTAAGPPLKLGVLSTARINRNLFRAARELPDLFAVSHVASRDPERAAAYAARHGIARTCRSYDELLSSPVDAVYIPLPAALHGTWTIQALRAGKHVLCEKPFAANESEARSMVETARAEGLVLMEAMHYRYHPLVERFYRIAREELGPIRSMDAAFIWPVPDLTDIRGVYELGGGTTMDMGCYPVHWLRTAAGEEPVVASARAIGAAHDPRVDLRIEAELAFPSGISGHYLASMEVDATPAFRFEVRGERGRVTADPFVSPECLVVRDASGTREERMPDAHGTFWYQLRVFHQCIRDGSEPPTAGADSIATMHVIDELYRASGLPVREPAPTGSAGLSARS